MKYVALCLIFFGVALLFAGAQSRPAGLMDGTIMLDVIAIAGGVFCIVAGLAIFAVLLFQAM